jgi:hypothetical protein
MVQDKNREVAPLVTPKALSGSWTQKSSEKQSKFKNQHQN